VRNLLPGEIAEQVRVVGADFGQRVSNVVVMGQGEAFQNYDAVLAALRIINAPEDTGGLGIGARHITLSTAGIIKGIERFSDEPEQFTLAVSLHSALQATRDKLMPGLRGQSVEKLGQALVNYCEKTGRRPSLEYALIKKVNTSPAEVDALIAFARKTKAHVNVIPLNEVGAKLKTADQPETLSFADKLRYAGVQVTVRKRRGVDIDAACGQLAQRQG
jgi:23S rRNA (adenine2503-C2)-methyltransferase